MAFSAWQWIGYFSEVQLTGCIFSLYKNYDSFFKETYQIILAKSIFDEPCCISSHVPFISPCIHYSFIICWHYWVDRFTKNTCYWLCDFKCQFFHNSGIEVNWCPQLEYIKFFEFYFNLGYVNFHSHTFVPIIHLTVGFINIPLIETRANLITAFLENIYIILNVYPILST